MTTEFTQGQWSAFRRFRDALLWRLNKCYEDQELSNTIVSRVESMVKDAESTFMLGDAYKALGKLVNAAVYLGRNMFS